MKYQYTIEKGSLKKLSIRDITDYYDLLWILVKRDIKILYKQTVLGFSWALLRPLIQMIIFSVVFGRLSNLPNDGIPYPLFYLSGLIPWIYFQTAFSKSSSSLITNSSIFTKVYFPRILLIFAPVFATLLDLLISVLFLVGMLIYYGIPFRINILLFPVCIIISILTSSGLGFWFSALSIKYRDVNHAMQFIIQIMMYLSPVIWPLSIFDNKFGEHTFLIKSLYSLYPLVGIIEGTRAAFFNSEIYWNIILTSLFSSIVIFITGIYYFKVKEKSFADVV